MNFFPSPPKHSDSTSLSIQSRPFKSWRELRITLLLEPVHHGTRNLMPFHFYSFVQWSVFRPTITLLRRRTCPRAFWITTAILDQPRFHILISTQLPGVIKSYDSFVSQLSNDTYILHLAHPAMRQMCWIIRR